jgi:hypothetical protein
VKTGVPQGAVTSPLLFNFYLVNLPVAPEGVHIIQYADDISIYCTGPVVDSLCDKINIYIDKVVDFLEERNLIVSAEKSTVTLFTPDPNQARLKPCIKIKGEIIRVEPAPKLLGITFNTMHTFTNQINNCVTKAKKKLNILKALAGTSWGQDKETIVMTYKSICRSTLEYASPIWTPSISDSNWGKLQRVQNSALRIATGCHNMAHWSHLHQECKVLPVRNHCEMVTKQYLVATHLPGHPGRNHLVRPPAPRDKKKSMLIFQNEVSNHIVEPLEEDHNYKQTLKSIHTQAVAAAITSYQLSNVIGFHPPEINKDELNLSRKQRTRLAQLRSGYCIITNYYKNIINEEDPITCPNCNSIGNVNHLFNCDENPTDLTP